MVIFGRGNCEPADTGRKRNRAGVRKSRAGVRTGILTMLLLAGIMVFSSCGRKEEPLRIEFYYENVCASCEGDADFFAMYSKCISQEEKEELDVEIATYNVFMDSCKERYEKESERLGIPSGTSLPVLVIGENWFGGYEAMEEALHRILVEEKETAR